MDNWRDYERILKTMVKPALGCTEPIAVAYAAALAREMLSNEPDMIKIAVSDNLYKNAMGVFVPSTGKIGLEIAGAVGAIGGKSSQGLEVLSHITPAMVEKAQALINAGKVKVQRRDVEEFIYCEVEINDGQNVAIVEISGGHTQVKSKYLNGKSLPLATSFHQPSISNTCDGVDISFQQIYHYALQEEFEKIAFILESATLNQALAEEGLVHHYGLAVGQTLAKNIEAKLLAEDLANKIIMYTSSASDARMGGASLPAMSNFGSGNQGIVATLPVVLTARHFQSSQEELARALIISHLGAIYIKSHYPPLSAFCGNTVTGAAAAAAMVFLAKGSFEQSCFAIQNVLSDCSGMICDGAKSTCAMKVKTATSSAVNAFLMALQNREAHHQGIVADDVEKTICNIGKLVTKGMCTTDRVIIDIMSENTKTIR